MVSVCPPNVAVEFLTKPLPLSVSENAPIGIEEGATEFRTGIGFCRVTVLLLFCVASSAMVAVTVIVFGVGRMAGAVYIPFASIVPTVALPPTIEFTDQVTPLFVLLLVLSLVLLFALLPVLFLLLLLARLLVRSPVPMLMPVLVLVVGLVLLPVIVVLLFMVAANASFDPARIVTLEGVTVIPVPLLPSSGASGEPSLPCFVPRPEQPLSNNIRSTACVFQIRFTDMPPSDLDNKHHSARSQSQSAGFASTNSP